MAFLAIENASSSSSSSVPPSSTPGCKCEYDVFLSFRGTDTRNNFTDHLYDRLKQVGILTFRDDERLEQGTKIDSGLRRAIDESKIAVVVLSKQYASSSWCLMELAKIVECMDKEKLTVLPVFHHVDPSDVKYQRGSFAEAFAKHENRFKDKIDDVKTWRAALTAVGNISGWHLKDDKSESEVIKEIIQTINRALDREVPFVSDEHLVGMDSRVEQVLDLCLGERLNCVRLIGIWGMGGIGKTTLAREIYNRLFRNFEASSFIADVREESESHSLVSLQNNILSKILMGTEKNISDVEEGKKILRNRLCNKKVLIVLDDVNDDKQLKALAGKDWFGPGSIIIVTSRYSHLLKTYWDGVIDIYKAKELNYDEALELFSLNAFKKLHPEENYVDLSINFVSYANGLPLALRDLGSSLFGKTLDAWRSAQDKIGYVYPLKSMPTSFQPNKLVELRMHNSDIKQLWKGIMILNELKLIDLSDSQNLIEIPDLGGAPNLKHLFLNGCTRLSNIHSSLGDLKRLIQLDLNGCKRLESLPHKINLEALEFFNLSGCSKLKKFPYIVENMPRLWELCLSETAIKDLALLVIHSTGLIELDLRDCKNLSSLPIAICSLMSLKSLYLSGCSKLDELPENLGKIEGLEVLDLSGTAITGLPSSFVHLKNLKVLSLSRCVDPMGMLECSLIGLCSLTILDLSYCNFRTIPNVLGCLSSLIGSCSLTTLDLSYCNVRTIPNVLGCLSSLEFLKLRGNIFVCLPESIVQLSNLRALYIGGCTHLRMLPKLPLNIKFIDATKCTSLETLSLRPESDFRPEFCLLDCNKLIKNQDHGDLFSTMLRRYIINTQVCLSLSLSLFLTCEVLSIMNCMLQGQQYSYHVMIPGSEIPKWFSHQNMGALVNLQGPSDLLGNKLMGIAVCAVFVFRKRDQGHLWCYVNGSAGMGAFLSEEFGKIESYQLWLQYFSSTYLAGYKETLNKVDTNGFSQFEVKFKPFSPGLEVTKCGAHLVFERDIEDLINQTKAGPSSCIITPYDEDGFEDSEKETKIKQSSDDSDGEGAGPSGDATSNDIDILHPKSVQLPNLIQRLMLCLGNWIGSLCAQRQGDSDCKEEEFQ